MAFVDLAQSASVFGFALAALLYLEAFNQGTPRPWARPIAMCLFGLATLASTVAMSFVAARQGFMDASGLLLVASIGWLTILAHLTWNLQMVAVFTSPLAALVALVHVFARPASQSPLAEGNSQWLTFTHVGFAILGETCAILACAVALLLLWQHRNLKKRQLTQLAAVPALDILSKVLVGLLWLGFIFLTFGLVSGALFQLFFSLPSSVQLEIKIAWALAVWVWYLLILLAKNIFRYHERSLAKMSFVGFFLLAISYFGMIFFRPWGNI